MKSLLFLTSSENRQIQILGLWNWMFHRASYLFRENRRSALYFGAGLVLGLALVVVGIAVYPFVANLVRQQCIMSVLNSKQSKLAFQIYQPETDVAIFIMTADGTHECRISGNDDYDFFPAWSPDGNQIAFVSNYYEAGRGNLSGIFIMNSDGSDRQMIVEGKQDYGYDEPIWSPDGNQIAFVSDYYEAGGGRLSEIFIMNSDGSDRRIIVEREQDYSYGRPTWSPDGKSIAFSKISSDESSKIYIANTEGVDPLQLVTASGFGDHSPAWSPDGKQIAFEMRAEYSTYGDIYIVNPDGSNKHPLTQNGGDPAWSPNGRQIIFKGGNINYPDLFIIDADGTNLSRLIAGESISNIYGLAWSPDGEQIAFSNMYDIYVVDVDGSDLRCLTKPDEDDLYGMPSWSGLES